MTISVNTAHFCADTDERTLQVRCFPDIGPVTTIWVGSGGGPIHLGLPIDDAADLAVSLLKAVDEANRRRDLHAELDDAELDTLDHF